jgi:hypothetical protein
VCARVCTIQEGAPHSIDLVWQRVLANGSVVRTPPGARVDDLSQRACLCVHVRVCLLIVCLSVVEWANATLHAGRIWGTFDAVESTSSMLAAIAFMQNMTDAYADVNAFAYSPFFPVRVVCMCVAVRLMRRSVHDTVRKPEGADDDVDWRRDGGRVGVGLVCNVVQCARVSGCFVW